MATARGMSRVAMAISVDGLGMSGDRIYNVSSVEEAETMYKQLSLEEVNINRSFGSFLDIGVCMFYKRCSGLHRNSRM